MTSPFLYAGINPQVWQIIRSGLLARGLAEPRQVPRPGDISAETLQGVTHVFVDGPSPRLQRVIDEVRAAGQAVPVIWMATEAEQSRAKPDLTQLAAAVLDWTAAQLAWTLPGEVLPTALPETPVLVPSGLGELEAERVAYLETGGYESSGPTDRLNRLTDWVAEYFGFPIAFVNLIGREMQIAKALSGMPEGMSMDMPKELSICQYVVAGNQPLVIPNIPESTFFKDAGVASMIGMEAYAGVPLVNEHQLVMGSLCMVDMQPHTISLTQMEVLTAVAKVVTDSLDDHTPDDSRLLLSGGSFNRLLQALLQDAQASGQPLCVASLPKRAAGAGWREGLEVFTVSTMWDCLVCLPQTTRKDATARLTEVLTEMGITVKPVIVEAQPGQKWMTLLSELTNQIRKAQGVEQAR
ncbi:MAG: GAF domain-containing protein [Candidatus Sericytochromatia bacterium]|nr:GAF domain-containing protein [Candidatus Sericytochromatia bacterium]